MIPLSDDLPPEATGAIPLVNAFRDYAFKILTDTYGYSPAVNMDRFLDYTLLPRPMVTLAP